MYEFPKDKLDAAVNSKFEGINAESVFDFFGGMTYVTNFETDDPILRDKVNSYIEGFMDGWVALRDTLENSKHD